MRKTVPDASAISAFIAWNRLLVCSLWHRMLELRAGMHTITSARVPPGTTCR